MSTRLDSTLTSKLPIPSGSLIGREREVAGLRSLLLRENQSLVVLTGPGGVGKTRLALHVAHDLAHDFTDGVYFVSLAAIRDPALVGPIIAHALEIPGANGRPLAEGLIRILSTADLLLVLDNFEHVLAAAPFIGELLAAAPGLKIVLTSRQTSGVAGEREFPLTALAVPAREMQEQLSTADLSRFSAVALFDQRARDVDQRFSLTSANITAVVEICRQLDGLPLAIELAAARTWLLPPDDLLARISTWLPMLTGGHHETPPRLQTMRAALDWSYELLPPSARALFHRLAVFSGGFTFESAQAICAVGDDPAHILGGLELLCRANLLKSDPGKVAHRFTMLNVIREFGHEKLAECGDSDEAYRLHATWHLALAEQLEPELYGGRKQAHALILLELDNDNLRAAMDYFIADGEAELALRLAKALLRFWYTRGHLKEGSNWLQRVLALSPSASAELRARALVGLAVLCWPLDDRDIAIAALQQALPLVERSDDLEGRAFARLAQAYIALDRGEFQAAADLAAEGKALYQALDRPWDAAMMTFCLAKTAHMQGNLPQAEALYGENLIALGDMGDLFGLATAQFSLGLIKSAQGNSRLALPLHASAVKHYQALGESLYVPATLEAMAAALGDLGLHEWASRLLGAASALRRKIGAESFFANPVSRDHTESAARQVLGNTAFQEAVVAGANAPLREIIAEASRFGLASPILDGMSRDTVTAKRTFGLSRREMDVLRLLVEGHSNPAIATTLFISHKTVRNHVTSILGKLNVESRTAAAAFAVRRGLV